MFTLYHLIIFQPLLNAMVFLYNTVAFHDWGLAIIMLTVAIRVILFPVFQKTLRHQTALQLIQPKLRKVQEEFKKDKKKQGEALMAIYKEHQINPFSPFLFMIVQIPLFIGLFQIVRGISTPDIFKSLYSFIHAPTSLDLSFVGLIHLGKPSIVIVLLAAAAQYLQTRLSFSKTLSSDATTAERITRNTALIAPLVTVIIFFRMPAAVSLYWLASSAFSVGQQYLVNRQMQSWKTGNHS